jgi:hypothetical protein
MTSSFLMNLARAKSERRPASREARLIEFLSFGRLAVNRNSINWVGSKCLRRVRLKLRVLCLDGRNQIWPKSLVFQNLPLPASNLSRVGSADGK